MEKIRERLSEDTELFPPHVMRGNERPRIGSVPGIVVGRTFESRQMLADENVHKPIVAGIWGGFSGAYSVVISGGYEDDVDEGETVIYTGAGGRGKDDECYGGNKPQTEDQTFEHNGNRALQKSAERGTPVRLIRGLTTSSTGGAYYRYDGLYDVISAELKDGKSGHKICQFVFKRQEGQAPLPPIGPPNAIPFSAAARNSSRSPRLQ